MVSEARRNSSATLHWRLDLDRVGSGLGADVHNLTGPDIVFWEMMSSSRWGSESEEACPPSEGHCRGAFED